MSSEFEKLADELEVLAKAQESPSEEDKVLMAAQEAGVDTDQMMGGAGDMDDMDGEDDMDDEDDEQDDKMLGKSFSVQGADGQPVRAYDATDLIKSLNARMVGLETSVGDEGERRVHLGKSLAVIADLLKTQQDCIASQDQQITALTKSVEALGGQGRGRRAVVSVSENPGAAMTKSMQPEGLSRNDFLAKAESAQKAGRISGRDVALAEAYLNSGKPMPAALVSRVMDVQ